MHSRHFILIFSCYNLHKRWIGTAYISINLNFILIVWIFKKKWFIKFTQFFFIFSIFATHYLVQIVILCYFRLLIGYIHIRCGQIHMLKDLTEWETIILCRLHNWWNSVVLMHMDISYSKIRFKFQEISMFLSNTV